MPTLMPTGDTPNDAPICGSDVEMIVPSRNCMKKAMATISATRWADAASACRRGPAVSEAVMNVHFVAALPLRGGPGDRIDRRPSTPRFNGGRRKIQAERGCPPRPRAGRISQFDLIGRSVFCLWGRLRRGRHRKCGGAPLQFVIRGLAPKCSRLATSG